MQLMMMNFGFEPVIAKRMAEKPHCTDEYLRVWIAHAKRDVDWKIDHHQDEKVLGPGFYYTHMNAGEFPLPLMKAKEQAKRDAAHEGDKAYWDVKKARQLASQQRKQHERITEAR